MTDATPAAAAPAADPANAVFNFDKLYIKDMSIEVPNAPQIFLETEAPALETSLNINAANFAEGMYEVTVTATVTTRIKEKVVFLVEIAQAGVFEIRNIPAEQLDPIIGIHCAAQIYPYLRGNVADVITRAGFPALHLPLVNFEAFYAQRLEQYREQPGTSGETAKPVLQ